MASQPVPALTALGIDVGTLTVKGVGLGADGRVVWRYSCRHYGEAATVLDECLGVVNGHPVKIGLPFGGTAIDVGHRFDPVVCLVEGVRACLPDASSILEVGGSQLTLVRLDESGQIASLQRNGLCASGTGSFLDEQAARLDISLPALPELPVVDPPGIATRCAVFAKSDLIHRQQEGFTQAALWSGLCRGLAEGVIGTLTHGRPLSGSIAVCGGVALNPWFVWWLNEHLARENGRTNVVRVHVVPEPAHAVAHGAALLAARSHVVPRGPVGRGAPAVIGTRRTVRPPLVLRRSRYPSAPASRQVDALGNEVSWHRDPAAHQPLRVVLGLDIGSTSTKCAVVERDGALVADVYRRTCGDPLGAAQQLLGALDRVSGRLGVEVDVTGVATTGSGRRLVGKVIGADRMLNEITAHGLGALHVDPRVETIFEIGGQDAKYIAVRGGRVADANMNYACAAGTGSFVEAAAAKLGYRTEEIGEAVLGVAPPYTSTRCTVFMEQDVLAMVRAGVPRRDALGAVVYSVIENYFERVVGRRPVSRERVVFQGATARNQGLVAAIENLLGVEVEVSPYCHVMGAYGAALSLLRDPVPRTGFRGLDLAQRSITIRQERCDLCVNHCQLSRAIIDGDPDGPVWGMLCGREATETRVRVAPEYRLFGRRVRQVARATQPGLTFRPARRVLLPRTLSTYSDLPFWNAFFTELGVGVDIGPDTDRTCIEIGRASAGAELCLPVKAAHGHVVGLIEGRPDAVVFFPSMIGEARTPGTTTSRLCPYVEAAPSLVRAALLNRGADVSRLVSPVLDFDLADAVLAPRLREALAPIGHFGDGGIRRALGCARRAREDARHALQHDVASALAAAKADGRPAVVVIGRPYNTLDREISLDLPLHLAECGVEVIPVDGLPFRPELLGGDFANMFWHYGQRILSALVQVRDTDGLYAVYMTSFGCGPDSFLLSYAEAIMGEKPLLVLELDEHGSTGYQTRVEAFVDVLRADMASGPRAQAPWRPPAEQSDPDAWRSRTMWLPQLHCCGTRLGAAVFRGAGYDARPLPFDDEDAHGCGKRFTRGGECLPAPLTLGRFLRQVEQDRADGRCPERDTALFLPSACGPCRFGQYRTLDRIVLDRLGLGAIPIFSPSGENAYYGIDRRLRSGILLAIAAGDVLFKMRCKVRPRERTAGDAEAAFAHWVDRAEDLLASGRMAWDAFLSSAADDFLRIPTDEGRLVPLVGIVGEIYVRSSDYANGGLVGAIEALGGEAWLAPFHEWIEYTTWFERYAARRRGAHFALRLALAGKGQFMHRAVARQYRAADRLLHDRREPPLDQVLALGGELLPLDFAGESVLTLGRARLFETEGADLVVNCAPFNCMHGNITTALFEHLRGRLRVPVFNAVYDETHGRDGLATFMHQASERCASRTSARRRARSSPDTMIHGDTR